MKLETQLLLQFVPLWCWSVHILQSSKFQVFTISKVVLAKKTTNYCNCQKGHWRFWQLGREQMGLLASWGNLRISLGSEDKHSNLNAFTKRGASWSCWHLNQFLVFSVKKKETHHNEHRNLQTVQSRLSLTLILRCYLTEMADDQGKHLIQYPIFFF